jgi:hypothetical protein
MTDIMKRKATKDNRKPYIFQFPLKELLPVSLYRAEIHLVPGTPYYLLQLFYEKTEELRCLRTTFKPQTIKHIIPQLLNAVQYVLAENPGSRLILTGSFKGDKLIAQSLANRLNKGTYHGLTILENKTITVSEFLKQEKDNGKYMMLLELGLGKAVTGLPDQIIYENHPDMRAYDQARQNLLTCRGVFKLALSLQSQIGPRMAELQAARNHLDKVLLKIFANDQVMLRHRPSMMSPHFVKRIDQIRVYLQNQ